MGRHSLSDLNSLILLINILFHDLVEVWIQVGRLRHRERSVRVLEL